MEKEYFDFTPHPSFLKVMGKVPFKEWQCIAELIDNSIDAIVNNPTNEPNKNTIYVTLPTQAKINSNQPIIIEDFAVGMTHSQLERALSAGDSSKNTTSSLGLFGMGFNLATSKLANTVEVWTSTSDDDKEIGAIIDLREMVKEDTFKREKLYREKKEGKTSGTEITIYDFNPGIAIRPQDIIRDLQKAYSAKIFNDLGIEILINQRRLKPFRFCVWDSKRSVRYKNEDVPVRFEIDEVIDEKLFCENCFSWLDDIPDTSLKIQCPNCKESDFNVKKKISVKGWVGIQRYSHTDLYGINISRNGRILSAYDKSFFNWDDTRVKDDPRFNPEYPRDTPAAGGRIVGEIEASFIIPEYTKDEFERLDLNWKRAVTFIRGEMPLQPDLAAKFGYKGERNRSPIGLLFSAYRKVSPPGSKTLIFSNKTGKADYITPRDWAKKFYDGDPDYQSDDKWWEAVNRSDLKSAGSTFDPLNPLGTRGDKAEEASKDNGVRIEKFSGKKILLRPRSYDLEKQINQRPIEVTLIEYFPTVEENEIRPIIFEPVAQNRFNVYINQDHPLFRDFADGYEELVLMEIANKWKSSLLSEEWTLTRIYYELKSRYAVDSMLNTSNLIFKAKSLIRDIQNYLTKSSGLHLETKPVLSSSEEARIKKEYLNIERKTLADIDALLATSKYVQYLDLEYIFKFVAEFPEYIFDNKFFSLPFLAIQEDELRNEQLTKYLGYFNDVKWFANELGNKSDESIKKLKQEIIRNKYSLQILNDNRIEL